MCNVLIKAWKFTDWFRRRIDLRWPQDLYFHWLPAIDGHWFGEFSDLTAVCDMRLSDCPDSWYIPGPQSVSDGHSGSVRVVGKMPYTDRHISCWCWCEHTVCVIWPVFVSSNLQGMFLVKSAWMELCYVERFSYKRWVTTGGIPVWAAPSLYDYWTAL